MSKLRVYLLGLLTLLMVPIAWLILRLPSLPGFFHFEEFSETWWLEGIAFGSCFAVIMLKLLETETADKSFERQIGLIKSMDLKLPDCIFLGLCAGIGEEFLFRLAAQEYLNPTLAAVIFVAIHGYLDPRDWDTTKYGLVVLVFILALSYSLQIAGIWFCIAAHAAYDVVLLHAWSIRGRREGFL